MWVTSQYIGDKLLTRMFTGSHRNSSIHCFISLIKNLFFFNNNFKSQIEYNAFLGDICQIPLETVTKIIWMSVSLLFCYLSIAYPTAEKFFHAVPIAAFITIDPCYLWQSFKCKTGVEITTTSSKILKEYKGQFPWTTEEGEIWREPAFPEKINQKRVDIDQWMFWKTTMI